MSFKQEVMDLLGDKPMNTTDIHSHTGMSLNYVRSQLRMMEAANLISRVDDRTPVIYKISDSNPIVANRKAVAIAKKNLLSPADNDEAKWIANYLKKFPKSTWPDAVESLEITAQAIRELANEGLLIDTL